MTLKLREIERNDIKEINKWRRDPELIALLGSTYRYINEEVDLSWFDTYMKSRNNCVRCAIVEEGEEAAILGCVNLLNIDRTNSCADFSIMIGDTQNRGKGLGSFATKEMLRHAFYDLNLHRVQLQVLTLNNRAINMYLKCGFVEEGIRRKAIFKNGRYIDIMMMSVLREDYVCE